MTFSFHQILLKEQVKQAEVCGTCRTHEKGEKTIHNFNLKL
jgi:hypothetical protein